MKSEVVGAVFNLLNIAPWAELTDASISNYLPEIILNHMAANKPVGDGHRIGAVKHREQVFNPKTQQWIKINTDTNLFMDVKQNGKPFKGVTKK